jgi:hypothetical protein
LCRYAEAEAEAADCVTPMPMKGNNEGGGGDASSAAAAGGAGGENGTAEAPDHGTTRVSEDGNMSSEDDAGSGSGSYGGGGGSLSTLPEGGEAVGAHADRSSSHATPRKIERHATSATPRLSRQSSVDPTLNIELPAKMESEVDEKMAKLGRGGGLGSGMLGQGGNVKKLELQVSVMAEKHVKLEAKLDEVMAAVKRMEVLLLAAAAKK